MLEEGLAPLTERMPTRSQSRRGLEEQLHWSLYKLLQHLRGRPVGAFIRQFQAWERLDRAEFERLQKARLTDALAYARARVPLYSTGKWQTALSRDDPADVLSWPVLDRHAVETHAAALIAQPAPAGLFFRSTSGSTGRPLRLARDPLTWSWELAAMYRGWLWHGMAPGGRTLRFLSRVDGPLREWVMNHKVISAVNVTPGRLETGAQILKTWQPTLLWGYPSAVFQLARYIRETRPAVSVPVVPYALLTGEPVFPFQRREIGRSLSAKVIQGYGASDAAWIAMECPAGSLHVMADHVHVEVLRDGKPVQAGELGDIVVTPLSNRAMPLVRYEVGDQGRLSPDPCPCGKPLPVLAELRGRTTDVMLTADGRPVPGSALTSGLGDIFPARSADAVRQVLCEQLDQRTWRVLVETERGCSEVLAARLADFVRSTFGAGCSVAVEPVPIITREVSGKFRYYRSQLTGQQSAASKAAR